MKFFFLSLSLLSVSSSCIFLIKLLISLISCKINIYRAFKYTLRAARRATVKVAIYNLLAYDFS